MDVEKALARAAVRRAQADATWRALIVEARSRGLSWRRIGSLAGVDASFALRVARRFSMPAAALPEQAPDDWPKSSIGEFLREESSSGS